MTGGIQHHGLEQEQRDRHEQGVVQLPVRQGVDGDAEPVAQDVERAAGPRLLMAASRDDPVGDMADEQQRRPIGGGGDVTKVGQPTVRELVQEVLDGLAGIVGSGKYFIQVGAGTAKHDE